MKSKRRRGVAGGGQSGDGQGVAESSGNRSPLSQPFEAALVAAAAAAAAATAAALALARRTSDASRSVQSRCALHLSWWFTISSRKFELPSTNDVRMSGMSPHQRRQYMQYIQSNWSSQFSRKRPPLRELVPGGGGALCPLAGLPLPALEAPPPPPAPPPVVDRRLRPTPDDNSDSEDFSRLQTTPTRTTSEDTGQLRLWATLTPGDSDFWQN
uniref:Uncharacterized protein n=1 Tax=Anopheles coluzzii TaxID=1518534 RepID=A0A8W7NYW9_ANOCL